MPTQTPTSTPPVRTAEFAWCGWSLALPAKWRPTRLEGDATKGSVLFADLDRPRLGLRWETPPAKRVLTRDEAEWLAGDLLRREVGRLAAGEATRLPHPRRRLDRLPRFTPSPSPPGRDVFVGVSRTSRRVVELVYHTRRRDRLLGDVLLPTLCDAADDGPRRWAIFDLSVTTPPAYAMESHTFSAGDLRLNLTRSRSAARRGRWSCGRSARPAWPCRASRWTVGWNGSWPSRCGSTSPAARRGRRATAWRKRSCGAGGTGGSGPSRRGWRRPSCTTRPTTACLLVRSASIAETTNGLCWHQCLL